MRVLVTGASGFVGAHLVRGLLAHGHEVLAGMRAESDPWRLDALGALQAHRTIVDLTDGPGLARVLEESRPEAIVHCAAYGVDHGQRDWRVALAINLEGALWLVEAAARVGVRRFIQLGTAHEYGSHLEAIPESALPAARTPYGATKAAASLLTLARAASLGLPLCVVRSSAMFGPLEGPHKLVPQIWHACLSRIPLALTPGEQVRDYLFVGDAAEALATMVERTPFPAGEVFNLGSGQGIRLREFVRACARQFGGEELMVFGALPYREDELWHVVVDVCKWERAFGPVPRTPLGRALEGFGPAPVAAERRP